MKLFNVDYNKPVYQNFKKNEILRPASYGFYWFCIVICLIYLLMLFITPVSAYAPSLYSTKPSGSTIYVGDVIYFNASYNGYSCYMKHTGNSVCDPYGSAFNYNYSQPNTNTFTLSQWVVDNTFPTGSIKYVDDLHGEGSNCYYYIAGGTRPNSFNLEITNNTGANPLQVHFNLTGYNIDYDNILYDFGDGTTYYVNTPTFDKFYSDDGTFDVEIWGLYKDSYVFNKIYNNAVTVYSDDGLPTADFGFIYTNGLQAPTNVAFVDYSYPDITSWSWYAFRGLNPSESYYSISQTPPSYWFNTSGVWYINLTVGNAVGYSSTVKGLYVYPNGNVTPITPTTTQTYITVSPSVYPTVIPDTTAIPNKNTVLFTAKNEAGVNQPEVSIQLWQYKCGYLDFLCVFGKHPEQIDGGFTDLNGNFLAILDAPSDFDYKAGGNLNSSLLKTYTSSTGSFYMPPDRVINITTKLYGIDTVLYTTDLHVYDFDNPALPIPNVLVRISQNGITTNTGATDNNGKFLALLMKGNYSLSFTKTNYYPAIEPLTVTGASQNTYYLHYMPIVIPTTTLTIAPTPTLFNGNLSSSSCRLSLDFNNETLFSPILNIESCVGIVNPVYQRYILAVLVDIILGVWVSRKYNSKEGFIIGVTIGNTLCAVTGLISWSLWIIVMIPMAIVFLYKGGGGK